MAGFSRREALNQAGGHAQRAPVLSGSLYEWYIQMDVSQAEYRREYRRIGIASGLYSTVAWHAREVE